MRGVEKPLICFPDKSGIDKNYPFFKNYLYDHRNGLLGPVSDAYFAALMERYPCRAAPAERRL